MVIDIPNAFIQTRVEDEKDMAIIKIRGIMVDILVDLAPDVYREFVTTDKKGVKKVSGTLSEYAVRNDGDKPAILS